MGNEDFERIKVIGKGSYGEVWLARHKKDKKQYVLKKLNLGKASKRERKSAEQEAKLLSKLKHPNIVAYKDSFETDNGFLFIAMQYCEGGDLYARLKEQKSVPLEERQVVEWFVQIAMALQYMHERNILHRDLKTQNIFLTKSKIIKVGDLGIARVLENASDMATTLIGTPYYMSPELFSNKPYNHKSDVWALGCCVYEMTTLKHAFNAKDMNSLVYKILKGRMPPMPRQYSVELLTLMRSMLHQDPEKRPSVNRILRDPYIKKNIAIFLEDTKKNNRRQVQSSANQLQAPSSRPSSASSLRKEPSGESEINKINEEILLVEPVFKSSLVRKPSDSALRDLEPIKEKVEEFKKSTTSESCESKVSSSLSKEINSPKKELPPRKKNFLKNHVKNNKSGDSDKLDGGDSLAKSAPPSQEVVHQSYVPEPQKPQLRKDDRRPLPLPKAEESKGLPQYREDKSKKKPDSSNSMKDLSGSSSKEDTDFSLDIETPRSLPNFSARQRRRQKNDTANSVENINSAMVKLKRLPEKTDSNGVNMQEKNEVSTNLSRPPRLKHQRQPSLNDSTSSSDESQRLSARSDANLKDKEIKREVKELNNFITLLDTTLHMNHAIEVSDDEEELKPADRHSAHIPSPEPQPTQKIHKSISMPSVETLTSQSRLMDRIKMLHKDCIQGVGYTALKRAYEILDKIDEDEIEPKLVDLLGKDKFDDYAGKIWQLKFCEEALFLA
ncbi:serine/threonine-protein kinase Nek4-like isoform X2 [Physella acuta]|uniref:serine/threonine-protein kinase Nek4-like isoform X2 n=1 Tax=Physella acuta TaxID=109671 RepID=UPI0027DB7F7B|nr:serine/threonine-protein kinase Nek4-like isoform X2 [Physella acuta]